MLLDIGVSSMQLDAPERGFSFQADGPLSMRMDGAADGALTAAQVVNTLPARALERILYRWGQEPYAKQIAAAIVAARPLQSTLALARVISDTVPAAEQGTRIHPATRVFQALRMHVNDELDELRAALHAADTFLKPSTGRLVIVFF